MAVVESDSSGVPPTPVKAVYPPGWSSRDAGSLSTPPPAPSAMSAHVQSTGFGHPWHARTLPERVTRHPPGPNDDHADCTERGGSNVTIKATSCFTQTALDHLTASDETMATGLHNDSDFLFLKKKRRSCSALTCRQTGQGACCHRPGLSSLVFLFFSFSSFHLVLV